MCSKQTVSFLGRVVGPHVMVIHKGQIPLRTAVRPASYLWSSSHRRHVSTKRAIRQLQPAPKILGSQQPSLIIFDKNGTLIDFHYAWIPWIQQLTSRLERATGLNLKQHIYNYLDICHFTDKARHGLLAQGTSSQVKRAVEDMLTNAGLVYRDAQIVTELCWEECHIYSHDTLKTESDLKNIFKDLKERDIKVAVCTSDSRSSTEKTLEALHLEKWVDRLICGDDVDNVPKPSGKNVETICRSVGVDVSEAVVIGDTGVDMEMGRNAGVGMVVGVLSGIGTRLDLKPLSDVVVENIQEAMPHILDSSFWRKNQQQTKMIPRVTKGSETDQSHSDKKASLVIFDKDGTLICFDSMWMPSIDIFIRRLEEATGFELGKEVLEGLGFDITRRKWGPGLFSEGTSKQCFDRVVEILQSKGMGEDEAEDILEKNWIDGDHGDRDLLKVFDDPLALFKTLKKHGIKIAICTSDDRHGTEVFVKTNGLEPYVDMMVCGDDPDNVPKPAANNALRICETLEVDPSQTVIIGDTKADLGMGQSAELGATVGVLSGVCDVPDLVRHKADHVIPSIKHVLPLVLPKVKKEV